MTIMVRRATPADARFVAECNRNLAEETEGKKLDPTILAKGVAAGLADERKALYFVAEEDGKVLGTLMITFEWSDWRNGWYWWIQSVYVVDEARRRGVFRALFEHVSETASQDPGIIGLRLYVEKANLAAQKTYQALGMKDAGYWVLEKFPLKR